MNMHASAMAIPISGNFGDSNGLKILPWNPINIPDLSELYDYSKVLKKPMSLQEIVQFTR